MRNVVAGATMATVVTLGGGAALGGERIEDNSFLVEEAYNQEPGVVQHISTMDLEQGNWVYGFTQEWPVVSQAHQLSFSLAYAKEGERTGFGDVMLNYRYQGWGVDGSWFAAAPRVSLILPTGVEATGGSGAFGVQVNLPVSLKLGGRWVAHSNLGGTWSGEGDAGGAARWNVFAGQSLIFLAHEHANAMVEAVVTHADDGMSTGTEVVVNPGVRFSIDVPGGLQIVPGVAVPVHRDLDAGETSAGVFFYLSLEHTLTP